MAHNTGSTVTCSRLKLAYYNLKLYELEIYDSIVAKVAVKIYRYRYRYRGKSLFTYRLLTELKFPLPYISVQKGQIIIHPASTYLMLIDWVDLAQNGVIIVQPPIIRVIQHLITKY